MTSRSPDSVVYLRANEACVPRSHPDRDVIKRAGIDRIGFVYALPEEKRR